AQNLWYSWNWDAVMLFSRMDPVLWEQSGFNPLRMLGMMSTDQLARLAADDSYVARVRRVRAELEKYLTDRSWADETLGDGVKADPDFLVAYFSTEYGIDKSLPIYSGGLGVLSGDHLKSASDLGVPLVGVGLLYQKGYFRQYLNLDGWQQEVYPDNDWYNMPVSQEIGPDGAQVTVTVDLAGENVVAAVWRAQVGRTPLYLLDTNLPVNSPAAREVTSTLYGGDREMRIRQEIVLGIGGVRALAALKLNPTVYHMNEGHSAFLAIERIRQVMARHGVSRETATEYVISTNVFTTHTPVPAGNEKFDNGLMRRYVERYSNEIGLSWPQFDALGKFSGAQDQFGMTVFALRTSGFANAVSRLHGTVSRHMWKDIWPGLDEAEVPITHVTNGIHTRT
ncbi:MAG TPA: alpha-glucan family phosphorylase, partial [Myxococcota bacterium]|nr:alpha-glucan family phosphorylase [Myxococcota bacterium]